MPQVSILRPGFREKIECAQVSMAGVPKKRFVLLGVKRQVFVVGVVETWDLCNMPKERS